MSSERLSLTDLAEIERLVRLFEGDAECIAAEQPDLISLTDQDLLSAVRLLSKFAQRLEDPVPTTEKLPGAEDCDSNGYCWWGNEAIAGSSHPVFSCSCWKYSARVGDGSHWLPYYALPLPPGRPKL